MDPLATRIQKSLGPSPTPKKTEKPKQTADILDSLHDAISDRDQETALILLSKLTVDLGLDSAVSFDLAT